LVDLFLGRLSVAYAAPSITASGTTLAQLQAGGASGHLELLIAAQAATVAPTAAATATATGGGSSGGLLAAGTYYFVVTETNGIGETTAGPVSAQLTVAAGDIPTVTFQTLKSGNTARNLYFGVVGGTSSGPFYLYASGITAGTKNCAVAVPANSYAVTPPSVNTTGLTFTNSMGNGDCKTLELIRSAKDGNLEDAYRYYGRVIRAFVEGDPVKFSSTIEKLRHAHTAFLMLATLCNEAGTLIDANAGTIIGAFTPIGTPELERTWP
jgi:hypothetical protein